MKCTQTAQHAENAGISAKVIKFPRTYAQDAQRSSTGWSELLNLVKPRNRTERVEVIGEALVAVGFIPAVAIIVLITALR